MATEHIKVPFFKKGKSRPTTSRKRSPSPSNKIVQPTALASSKSEVVLPTRKAGGNLLSAGTKRTATQREDNDDPDAPVKEGPDVKWTASGSHVNAALEILAGDEIEELNLKRRKKDEDEEDEDEIPDDGVYRGQGAYRSHLKKNKEIPKAMRVGPQRSTSTIRTVTIVDYQPDVCKDYKGKFNFYDSRAQQLTACRNRLLRIWRHL
jgi:RING finger protein 113A